MKRAWLILAAALLLPASAQASGGFSCQSGDDDPVKVVVEGATPRLEPGLLNFGGTVAFDGKKAELRKSDVQSFLGANGVIRIRVGFRAGGVVHTLRVEVKRNPQDEDDWPGTYEISAAAGGKDKALKRGKVTCSVE